jgi:hypothetical protein
MLKVIFSLKRGKGVKLIFQIYFLSIDPSVKFFGKNSQFLIWPFLKIFPNVVDEGLEILQINGVDCWI